MIVVSALLFISGIGFIVASARAAQQSPAASAPAAAPLTPVASVKQIMNGIVSPSSTVIYDAVSSSATATGIEEIAPKDDAEWARVGDNAAALAEAGNMLMIDGRAIDKGDWVQMSKAMIDGAARALKAAETKDKEGILSAGSAINETCDKCHARYQRQ
jgi:hypothetical protein